MIPEGNPQDKTAGTTGRSQKFKKALTTRFWQPLPWRHLLPGIWCFDVPPPRLGVGGGVEPMRESPSSGPSEPCDCHVPLLSLILPLPHLRRRRLCVCACVHLGPLSVESNFAKLLGRTHLSNLTIGARHALHSHWWLPLFAYRACLRGLGHLQQRVS